jgi:hypothetical protein
MAALVGMPVAVNRSMPTTYPVRVEVISPNKFDRFQLLLRIALSVAFGVIGVSLGWLAGVLYFVLPVVASIAISTKGADDYLASFGQRLWRALTWLLGLSAYMLLVVDHAPDPEQPDVRIELDPAARPSAGSALARLITSIPSAFVLWLLSIVSALFVVISFFCVLFAASIPASILSFQVGILRWSARLLAYHACLVDEYPPFSFGERSTATPTSVAS